jgi:hypothetical protein
MTEEEDYRGYHSAPGRDNEGVPMYAMDKIYPEDIYSPQGIRYYGSGGREAVWKAADRESMDAILRTKGRPNADVVIYRAVPLKATKINNRDWVTPSLSYARIHLNGPLNGEGRILKKTVKAKDLYSEGNSINEFGYDPEGKED